METSKPAKEKMTRAQLMELIVVILLGITALLTAWASWIGSLHGGNQATAYATSNNLASEGNSEYNAGIQTFMSDMMLYNEVNALMIDLAFAEEQGDDTEVERISWKLDELENKSVSPELAEAIEWSVNQENETGEYTSPFDKEGFVESYFGAANELLEQSETELQKGQKANEDGDAFGLVTVIYSVVLFLLGITGTFKSDKNQIAVTAISCAAFLIATIYMFTIPMPEGFSFGGFFGG